MQGRFALLWRDGVVCGGCNNNPARLELQPRVRPPVLQRPRAHRDLDETERPLCHSRNPMRAPGRRTWSLIRKGNGQKAPGMVPPDDHRATPEEKQTAAAMDGGDPRPPPRAPTAPASGSGKVLEIYSGCPAGFTDVDPATRCRAHEKVHRFPFSMSRVKRSGFCTPELVGGRTSLRGWAGSGPRGGSNVHSVLRFAGEQRRVTNVDSLPRRQNDAKKQLASPPPLRGRSVEEPQARYRYPTRLRHLRDVGRHEHP